MGKKEKRISPTLYVRRTENKQEEFMELSEWVNCQNIRKFHVLHMFLTFSTSKRTRKRPGTPWKSVALFRPPAIHPSELSRERQIVEISFHSFEISRRVFINFSQSNKNSFVDYELVGFPSRPRSMNFSWTFSVSHFLINSLTQLTTNIYLMNIVHVRNGLEE